MEDVYLSILKKYWGYDGFRGIQREIIESIGNGRDTLGLMPTGGGKSITFQVPALSRDGICIVVTPLIALMKDQVRNLRGRGIKAAAVYSGLSREEILVTLENCIFGNYKFLYVSPERLASDIFLAKVRHMPVSFLTVDEAHCISQWGQDFRPSYRSIPDFVASLPQRPPVTALTATATAEVQQDIVRLLELYDPVRCVTGFDRPNLFFDVQRPKNKMSALLDLLWTRRDKTGIVYCATRAAAERVCRTLCSRGVAAVCYHAGMEDGERRASQDDFQFDRKNVIVATNAFGMGIDKSNVNFVIHYNMPKSLEAYYQEAGRAGRDGEAADCILLYSAGDVETAKFLIQSGGEELGDAEREELRRRDYERLKIMTGYCKTTRCLRGYILDYFGQPHAEECGNCGNCRRTYRLEDITIPAQMILSCVVRVRETLGYYVGKMLIVQTLRGSRDRRLLQLGLDRLSTYGLMRKLSAEKVLAMLDRLEEAGYLRTNAQHFTLEPTAAANGVLFGGEKIAMPVHLEPAAQSGEKKRRRKSAAASAPTTGTDDLFAALKAERTRLAAAEGVPAYVVFSNATLADMAAKAPRTMEDFLEVSGVGEIKAARYGEAFLKAIAAYEEADEA